jgi:D-hydroxyproline dehydrogenase subunit gamma
MSDELEVTIDGRPVTAAPGRTIAGIMLAEGVTAWRRDTAGELRGVFCGIGVCFECLVTVNGQDSVRACQRVARDGDDIRTGRAER